VLVLGDIGRSPRMQYHAISFAKEGFTVDIIGYPGSSPLKEIIESPCIQIHYLRPPPKLQNSRNWILYFYVFILTSLKITMYRIFENIKNRINFILHILIFECFFNFLVVNVCETFNSIGMLILFFIILGLPFFLCYIVKIIWQTIDLLWLLFSKRIPDTLIMQNPPAIPTIPICWFYCVLTETQFIIDWHNYAYSLMALSLGNNHILVKLAKAIEIIFGRRATYNFCVTKAMKNDLEKKAIQLVLTELLKKLMYRKISLCNIFKSCIIF
jgi:hypothetical protein